MGSLSLDCVPGGQPRGSPRVPDLRPKQPDAVIMCPTVFHLQGSRPHPLSSRQPPKVQTKLVQHTWKAAATSLGPSLPLPSQSPSTPDDDWWERSTHKEVDGMVELDIISEARIERVRRWEGLDQMDHIEIAIEQVTSSLEETTNRNKGQRGDGELPARALPSPLPRPRQVLFRSHSPFHGGPSNCRVLLTASPPEQQPADQNT